MGPRIFRRGTWLGRYRAGGRGRAQPGWREGGRAPARCPRRSHLRMTRASGAYRLVDRPSAHRKRAASRRVVARPSRRMPGWGAARMRRERRGWIAREASGRPARWRKYSAWKRRAWHSRPKSLSRRARPRPSVSWIAALQLKICWKRGSGGPLARNSEPSDWLLIRTRAHGRGHVTCVISSGKMRFRVEGFYPKDHGSKGHCRPMRPKIVGAGVVNPSHFRHPFGSCLGTLSRPSD